MKFAIIFYQGHQYKIKVGDIITVDKLNQKVGETLTISSVLLVQNDDHTQIGNPYLVGNDITVKVLENLKGEKIDVFKYKNKTRYRRHTGFRAQLTKIEIVSIGKSTKVPEKSL